MSLSFKKLSKNKILPNSLSTLVFLFVLLICAFFADNKNDNLVKRFLGISSEEEQVGATSLLTPTPTPSPTPIPTPTPVSVKQTSNVYQSATTSQWGVAKQLTAHTWTLQVGQDSQMATPQEILVALNNYRQNHGSQTLSWDNNLANFAQERANSFNAAGTLDEHAGFYAYLANPDNEKQIGFLNLGENSSIGFTLEGVHLIEWVYASDEGHNKNQLDTKWTHVGIGVSGTATDLVFGG